MSKINSPPIGLQSLLGSKNFGENPDDLGQQVRPVVDMLPFWASQRLRFLNAKTNSSGQQSVVEIQVPLGETWMILSVAFDVEMLAAADDMNSKIALDETNTGVDWYTVASNFFMNVSSMNGQFFTTMWNPPIGFFLSGGTVIRGIHQGSNQAAKDFELDVVYYRLEI